MNGSESFAKLGTREKIWELENRVIPVLSDFETSRVEYRYENNDALTSGVMTPIVDSKSSDMSSQYEGLSTLARVIENLCDQYGYNTNSFIGQYRDLALKLEDCKIGMTDDNFVKSHFDSVIGNEHYQIYKSDKEALAYELLEEQVKLLTNTFLDLSSYVGQNVPNMDYVHSYNYSYYDSSNTSYTVVNNSFETCKNALMRCCKIIGIPYGTKISMENIESSKSI